MAENTMAGAHERVALTDEQIDALEREFDAACLIQEWRRSRRGTRDVAHKAFRDLIVTVRTERANRNRAVDLWSDVRAFYLTADFVGVRSDETAALNAFIDAMDDLQEGRSPLSERAAPNEAKL